MSATPDATSDVVHSAPVGDVLPCCGKHRSDFARDTVVTTDPTQITCLPWRGHSVEEVATWTKQLLERDLRDAARDLELAQRRAREFEDEIGLARNRVYVISRCLAQIKAQP